MPSREDSSSSATAQESSSSATALPAAGRPTKVMWANENKLMLAEERLPMLRHVYPHKAKHENASV